jgi:predicted enzyme related to lactoylglutathione lyase
MDLVVHFEMPAGDSKRMSEFYTKAFGWEMKRLDIARLREVSEGKY